MNGWRWSAPRKGCKLCYQHRQTSEHVAPLTGCGHDADPFIHIHLLTEVQSMYSCRKHPKPRGWRNFARGSEKCKMSRLSQGSMLNLHFSILNFHFAILLP